MTNENLSLGIKRLPYSQMLKSEVADYVEKTIAIVENHDLESPLITPMFEKVRAKEADIKLLRLCYGIDTERLRVNKVKSKMMLVFSAFKIKVKLISKSNPELDMHPIQNAINKHLSLLHKTKNDKQLTQKVAGFFDLLNENEELSTALNDFDLTSEVDSMKAIFAQMERATKKRVALLSQRPKVSTRAIVNGMREAVDNLFKGIEVANMVGTLPDGEEPGEPIEVVPLIDELNQLSDMYSRSISIRVANNKRKAKGEDETEGETEGEDEPIEVPEDPNEDGDPQNRQTTALNDTEGMGDSSVGLIRENEDD